MKLIRTYGRTAGAAETLIQSPRNPRLHLDRKR